MASLCMGAVPTMSLGNREDGESDDLSQETCPDVEAKFCDLRNRILTMVFWFPKLEYRR